MAYNSSDIAKIKDVDKLAQKVSTRLNALNGSTFKAVAMIGNTINFYTSSDTTQTPADTIDIPSEQFVDQLATGFVPNFTFSGLIYDGATNPNLDGKPVLVLGVKSKNNDGNAESIAYSFIDLSSLIDIYTASDTSVTILDYKVKVNISSETGNCLSLTNSGLYAQGITDTATTLTAGLMSAEDKIKLDDLSNYTLSAATSESLGGVKIGDNISADSDGTIFITQSDVTNALGFIPVSVNTTYDNATTDTSGLMSADDKIKLNGIEDSAQVNVIEIFKFNDTALPVNDDKSVNLDLSSYLTEADATNTYLAKTDAATIYATKSELSGISDTYAAKSDLSGYVATETGKGLSSNDFTDSYKSKLDSVDTSTYLAKSAAATIYATKTELSSISDTYATKTELNNKLDSDAKAASATFADSAYQATLDGAGKNIANTYLTSSGAATIYATKNELTSLTDTYVTKSELTGISDTYATKSELSDYVQKNDIASALIYRGSVNSFSALPTDTAIGDVYNIATSGGTDSNGTPIKAGDNVAYNGSGWDVLAGSVDLSGYLSKSDAQSTYVTTETGKGLSSNDFTDSYKTRLDGIADSAQVNVIETVKVNNTALTPTDKAVNIDLANATVKSAASLNSSQSLKVSLNSTSAQSFNGSDNATVIGVGGTLQPANGGTGATDLNNITVGGANRDGDGNVIKDFYVSKSDFKKLSNSVPVRFGYRIKKTESSPSNRVEYLYDAQGRTPAAMNLSSGVFNYGDWADAWFVNDNKPLMLKYNGSVDYYLDPNDYTKKIDGTASDVSNSSYGGNAMAQMPLCWFKRYEDDNYNYEIVSNVQWDDDYKAYAHIDANGKLKPYFYSGLFPCVIESSKCRSLKGKTASFISTADAFSGVANNGSGWYFHSWAQHNYFRTLCVLLGKSTNSQAVFGNGAHSEVIRTTGTLSNKGQFWGSSGNSNRMKFLHVESLYEDRFVYAGAINYNGTFYVKMTPEGDGYQYTNVNGYTNTGISAFDAGGYYHIAFLKDITVNEYGFFPKSTGATYYNYSTGSNQYFCDWLALNTVNGIALISSSYIVSDQITAQGIFVFCGGDVDAVGNKQIVPKIAYV